MGAGQAGVEAALVEEDEPVGIGLDREPALRRLQTLRQGDLFNQAVVCDFAFDRDLDLSNNYGANEPLTYDYPKLASLQRPAETLLIADGKGRPTNASDRSACAAMQGSGFTFKNPNATGGCGCGTSFSA